MSAPNLPPVDPEQGWLDDDRVEKMERLVYSALCRCRTDGLARYFNGCPLHSPYGGTLYARPSTRPIVDGHH